jgi:hypothetical protein
MTGATALSTLGATIAPRRFLNACRTAKVVIGNRMRKGEIPAEPPFDAESAKYFRDQLARARNYLEYGSGGSTVLANQLVTNLVSVDCDASLLADVRRTLCQNDRRAMAKLIHVNIGMTISEAHAQARTPLGRIRQGSMALLQDNRATTRPGTRGRPLPGSVRAGKPAQPLTDE